MFRRVERATNNRWRYSENRGEEVKVGIALGALPLSVWVEAVRAADRLGYESVWISEHLVIPTSLSGSPYADGHRAFPLNEPFFDMFAYLAFLAGQTDRVRLGTYVYNIGLRHPFTTARAVATLDVVSQGRVEFGIGASWLQAEWEAVGLDFTRRGQRVDEAIDVCQRLWNEEVVEYHGEFFDFEPVMFEPKPVQRPWPPLHIGGDGPAALRRAALVGTGWAPMNHSLEQIPRGAERLAALRQEAGIPGTVEITIGAGDVGLEDLHRYADAGVARVLVRPWRDPADGLEGLERFGSEVLPRAGDIQAAS